MRRGGRTAFTRLILATVLVFAAGGLLWRVAAPLVSWSRSAGGLGASSARVVRVIDGDTLVVRVGSVEERVRLLGVDTPEMAAGQWPGEYLANEAKAFVQELAAGAEVRLLGDPQRKARDDYGRLLRYVDLPDGRSLNAELIRGGFGYVFTRFPCSRTEEFQRLEAEARERGRGVWAEDGSAELRWNAAHGIAALQLHPMGNRSWAIRYGERVKPFVRSQDLSRELGWLRRMIEENAGDGLASLLAERGYRARRP